MKFFQQSSTRMWVSGPVLGRGATATVSLATSPLTGDVFAVKSADLPCSTPLQREQGFLSSAAGCSPYIISYLGSHVTPASYHLFLEFAPGGSLADEIQRNGLKGLEECQIRGYARDMLMGLSHLHSRGVAHCDVKPRNVLLAADGTAKLADLGCARWIDGRRGEQDDLGNSHNMFNGTPMFMAPEVARGERQGPEADIWALGCTVVEMATGRPPWPGATDPVSAVHRIAFSADVPEAPKGLLSNEAREFLDLCLNRDHRERWSAERLLKHPFIVNADMQGDSSGRRSPNWPSPKCVLDQDDFWGSVEEEEDHTMVMMDTENDDAAERMRHLAPSSTSSSSGWEWGDEDWITVRSGCGDDSAATACSTSSTDESALEASYFRTVETSSCLLTPAPAGSFLVPSPATATTTRSKEGFTNLVVAVNKHSIVLCGDDGSIILGRSTSHCNYPSCNFGFHTRDSDFLPHNQTYHCCYSCLHSVAAPVFQFNFILFISAVFDLPVELLAVAFG